MNVLLMKHLCILLIVCWSSVVNGNAVGHVLSQHSPLQLKSDGNNVEVYRDTGNGSSWLQMVLVFARDSTNSQSASLIEDKPCTECEKTTACKDGFIELESQKCYYFNQSNTSWHDALKVCQSMDTTLAYPSSAIEKTAIVKRLDTNLSGTQGWWLGGTDEAKEGEWVWTHNKAPLVYTDWLEGQPNNANNDQHCLQYWKDSKWHWNDLLCTDVYPFICQQ